MTYEESTFRARITAGLENDRTNPAVAADREFKPEIWTEADEVAFQALNYGSDQERLYKLVEEHNRRQRRTL